jgi:hypothetical protein
VHEWLFLSEKATVADAAAEDLAEDVAATFVRWEDAVRDEEGGGAGVVGDDAKAGVALCVGECPGRVEGKCGGLSTPVGRSR